MFDWMQLNLNDGSYLFFNTLKWLKSGKQEIYDITQIELVIKIIIYLHGVTVQYSVISYDNNDLYEINPN